MNIHRFEMTRIEAGYFVFDTVTFMRQLRRMIIVGGVNVPEKE